MILLYLPGQQIEMDDGVKPVGTAGALFEGGKLSLGSLERCMKSETGLYGLG